MSWWDDVAGGASGSVGSGGGAGGNRDPWADVNSGAGGSVGASGGAQGGPRAGSPHPQYAGCFWDPRFNDYICDDGYTVSGEEPVWNATGGAAGGVSSSNQQQSPPPPPGRDPRPPGNNMSPYLLIGVVVLVGAFALRK